MSQNNDSAGQQFSFVEAEKQIQAFWKEKKIFEKSLEKTKNNAPYIFYDGPPFATGLPHHGHIVASTLKDIVPRFFTMKGKYVSRRFGWDCHGLPIEHEIDKKLGMSTHDAVAKLGIKGYNDECRSIVDRFTNEWEKTISRLGRWVDFENDYKTMDLNFMESVWWVFNECFKKGLIYQGTKVVPFSTALGTPLSNFEANLNYQDVQDPAVTVLFKMKDEDAYLAAWTTTPWTLPSNLALCVNADVDYVRAKDEKRNIEIYFAKERLEYYQKKNNLVEVATVKGADLKGKKYEPLFEYFKDLHADGCFQVLTDDYVTTTDGTGIVHQAPAFGEDDNRVLKEAGIKAIVCPVNNQGKFTDEVSDFQGLHVKDADKGIIKKLKDEDKLYLQEVLQHSYPFCYRSDTPLIYKAIPSWYLEVEKIKDKMMANNKEITWVPDHIKEGRFGKWLENARDWAISRNRVWGTPLPIWINDETNNVKCFGSVEELEKATGEKISDLHREFVDDLTFTVNGETGTYRRITEVLDCWFESGSMPYAQLHYPFENKEVFEQGFPAEFIAEGLDQTRGWFYTLTVLSTALFDKPAFKNVIVNGMVLASDGKKMSKRLKNYTPPDELMEEFGADALRLFLITSGLVKAEELKFTDEGVKDMVRRALLPWYNSFKFFMTYAEVDGWRPQVNYQEGDNILDRWIISRSQTLIQQVTEQMESYQLYNVVPALFDFIEDLTNTYIRLNRRRFWADGLEADKAQAYSTLYQSLVTLSKLMAPFAPFLSDYIYLELSKLGGLQEESVHLESYPESLSEKANTSLEDAVERMKQILILGRQQRNKKQIKVKTPLKDLVIIHQDKSLLENISQLESYIKTELNIKQVNYSQDEDKYINLFCKPNSPVLGKRLGKKFGPMRGKIEKLSSDELKKFESGQTIQIEDESFSGEDLLVFREPKDGTEAISNRLISLELNCQLDEELINEGLAREIVNRIQKSRKELNFNVSDRIKITYSGDETLNKVFSEHMDYIKKETLTTEANQDAPETPMSFKIDGHLIEFELQKA